MNYEEVLKGSYSNLENGKSGTAKLLVYKKKKYVVRTFKDKEKSDEIYKIYKKLKKFNFLPKLLYKKDNVFLFEYIPGRECKKPPENLEVVRQVAIICAKVNKIKFSKKVDLDKDFTEKLKIILKNKKINKKQYSTLQKRYKVLKKIAKPKIFLDAWDIHQGNFIINKKKVYMIDLGGIGLGYRGLGIIKSYYWFKKENQRDAFRKSYNSILSLKYFDSEYENFMKFYYYICYVAHRLRKYNEFGEGSKKRLKQALELVE